MNGGYMHLQFLDARTIAEEMPGGFFIYLAHENEEILYANKALYHIFGCEGEEDFLELTGGTFPGMVHPDDVQKVEESIWQQIEENRYDLDYVEYRIVQKGGEIRWIEDYGHFLHTDFAGDVFYVFAGDATEKHRRQQMEQRRMLEEAFGLARASSRAKSAFLSNISHDIRTPMNAILGYTALAKIDLDDEEKMLSYLNKIEASADQLLALLDDVLELSRLESGKALLEDAPCNLREVAGQVREVVLPKAEAKAIRFSMDLQGLDHPLVYGSASGLVQILLRLADNAVKYTKNGGEVEISINERDATKDFATFCLAVKDTGIGISKDFLGHIFEPFERQRNTTLSGVQGMGLGLAIVKNLVEMMGGTIEVSSVSGEGSCFTIVLGLRLQQEDGRDESGRNLSANPAAQPGSGCILLVEDNEINREIETEILGGHGFIVDTASNGNIALEKVRNSKPGYYRVILMDIQMPVMDGYAAAKAIRSIEDPVLSGIPIIALSANTFEEDKKKALESGMNAHIEKPIRIPKLLELIGKIAF